MVDTERICPRCGRSSEEIDFIGNMCRECYVEVYGVAKIPNRLHYVVCQYCGRYKYQGGWNEPSGDVSETLKDYVIMYLTKKIKPTRDIEEAWVEKVTLERPLTGPGIYKATVEIAGKSGNTVVREQRLVEIKVDLGACPECTNRLTKRGYNAIIQIRSSEGKLSRKMRERIEEFILEELSGVLRSTIIGTEEYREGFDLLVSDPSSARMIASKIKHAFMGKTVETWKLIGRRQDGKRKGRLTILVRVPEIDVGDILLIGGQPYYYLAKSRSGSPIMIELSTGREVTVKPERLWEEGFREYDIDLSSKYMLLLSKSEKKIIFLDENNGYIVEEYPARKVRILVDKFEQGKRYRVVQVKDKLYVIGEHEGP